MKIEDIIAPIDAPFLYFSRETAALRGRVEGLEKAARAALELLEDPDAEPEDADAVTAALRRVLAPVDLL